MKDLVADAFAQGRKLLGPSKGGSEIFQHILCTLCRSSSQALPTAVLQALESVMVDEPGTAFALYTAEVGLLPNALCVGPFAPKDATVQMAIETSIDDRFAIFECPDFGGKNSARDSV